MICATDGYTGTLGRFCVNYGATQPTQCTQSASSSSCWAKSGHWEYCNTALTPYCQTILYASGSNEPAQYSSVRCTAVDISPTIFVYYQAATATATTLTTEQNIPSTASNTAVQGTSSANAPKSSTSSSSTASPSTTASTSIPVNTDSPTSTSTSTAPQSSESQSNNSSATSITRVTVGDIAGIVSAIVGGIGIVMATLSALYPKVAKRWLKNVWGAYCCCCGCDDDEHESFDRDATRNETVRPHYPVQHFAPTIGSAIHSPMTNTQDYNVQSPYLAPGASVEHMETQREKKIKVVIQHMSGNVYN